MATLIKTLNDFFEAHQLWQKKVVVAVSGGVDSTVLLHALCVLRDQKPFALRAIHVHHGLLPEADQWSVDCEKLCRAWQVDLTCVNQKVTRKGGESLEAEARKARYQAFQNDLKPNEILCLAQHQDDQVETFLLQWLRGCGLKGLCGMPVMRPFHQAQIARPLLAMSRDEIMTYANDNQLIWHEDPSNQDQTIKRNALRHQILPVLKTIQPQCLNNVSRTIAHIQEAQCLLEDFAVLLLKTVEGLAGLNIAKLRALPESQQKLVLRYWIQQCGIQLPSQAVLQHIIDDVVMSKPDVNPCVEWASVKCQRDKGYLVLKPKVSL